MAEGKKDQDDRLAEALEENARLGEELAHVHAQLGVMVDATEILDKEFTGYQA